MKVKKAKGFFVAAVCLMLAFAGSCGEQLPSSGSGSDPLPPATSSSDSVSGGNSSAPDETPGVPTVTPAAATADVGGDTADLTFTVGYNKGTFSKLLSDGREVESSAYERQASRLILKGGYLKTLTSGVHEFTLVTDGGEAKFTVTVNFSGINFTDTQRVKKYSVSNVSFSVDLGGNQPARVTVAGAEVGAEALEDAINKLVALAKDKTALKAKIDEAKAIDGEEYLSAGVTALGEALGAAEDVYADAQASEKEAADALKALTEALEALEEKADTTALEGLVAEVKAAAYDGENYTAASFAALEDALAEAEELLAKAEISKTDADGAKTALETAVEGLVAFGDPAALKALIAEVKAFSAADYVKNGFDALTAEIANAEAVAATKDVQSIYDAAKAALEEKKGALVSLVALKEAVAEAKEYEKEGYTELSYSALKTALSEAELVLAKANATADEITAAVGAVNAAVEGLEEKTPVPPITSDSDADSKADSNSEKESGCGSVAGFSGAIALLAGCAILLKKKQR